MDENDLKNLLDEALTYKNPRDANEKSETFKVSLSIASLLSYLAHTFMCVCLCYFLMVKHVLFLKIQHNTLH